MTEKEKKLFCLKLKKKSKEISPFLFLLIRLELSEVIEKFGSQSGPLFCQQIIGFISEYLKSIECPEYCIDYDSNNFLMVAVPFERFKNHLYKKLQDLQKSINDPIVCRNEIVCLKSNICVSSFPGDAKKIQGLFDITSDILNLYGSKNEDKIIFCDKNLGDKYQKFFVIENEMKNCLANGTIRVHYSIKHISIKKVPYELIDVHPVLTIKELGEIPNEDFIKVAKDCEEIIDLGKKIRMLSMHDFALLNTHRNHNRILGIPIFYPELKDVDFVNCIIRTIRDNDLKSTDILLKIFTEKKLEKAAYQNIVRQLEEAGIQYEWNQIK